jgi:SpoVK/Ycf46/Vps4 family AAA+-type ATPase
LSALHILSRYAIEATPLFDLIQFHLLSTDAVERASQYTHELYVEKELSISFEVLTIEKYEDVNSTANSKPWRYLEEEYCQNDWYQRGKKILSRRVSNDIVLTCDSLWFSLSTNSLLRLCIQDADDSARSHTNLSRVTPLCAKLGDLLFLQVPIVGASLWIPPPNDQHLSTAFWKTHYCRQVIHNWIHPFLKQKYLVDAWIVQGDVGTGKTNSVHTVAAMARLKWAMPVFYLDCKRLQSTSDMLMNSILLELTEVFREALRFMPSIMILDDLDCLVIHDGSGSQDDHIHSLNEQSKLLANHLQTWLSLCMSKVIWVISCRSLDCIPPDILETFNCFETIQLPALTSMERGCITASMFSHDYNEIACQIISRKCDGYRVKDLSIISSRMQRMAKENNISKEDIVEVIEGYVPLSRQGISDNTDSYDQDWNCVGGIFEAKERLKSIVLNPIKYKRIYDKSPISLPKGILLFGPPGCGKTYMVPALARECNYNLITCRGPELLDRYIGASEANVRRLFERARSAAPSILFLDEFDALAPRRGSDHTGVTDRVVNQLLTYLDGVETFTSENVFMIAATSRPDKIDPALLRPGRLEQHIYIGYPESFEEWMDILTKMMKTRQIDLSLAEAIQSKSLVWTKDEIQRLSQFSPADIKAVLDTAQLHSIHEYLNSLKDDDEGNLPTIQEHHLRRAILETRPSLPSSDRAMHAAIYQDFGFSGLSQVREIRRQTKLKTSLREI